MELTILSRQNEILLFPPHNIFISSCFFRPLKIETSLQCHHLGNYVSFKKWIDLK